MWFNGGMGEVVKMIVKVVCSLAPLQNNEWPGDEEYF